MKLRDRVAQTERMGQTRNAQTRQAMYVERNIEAYSRDHCCRGKTNDN